MRLPRSPNLALACLALALAVHPSCWYGCGGQTQRISTAGACSSNDDCAAHEACAPNGSCATLCNVSSDCAADERCTAGLCMEVEDAECASDDDCAALTCNPTSAPGRVRTISAMA